MWSGIDVAWHGSNDLLEYDFTVAPGADPSVIALAFDGVDGVRLDHGDLVLSTSGGNLRHRAPHLFQDAAGTRQDVAGRFILLGGGRVGFATGSYDHTQPLVIDPTLAWSTLFGRSGFDIAGDIAIDSAGDAYLTGWTVSADVGATPNAFDTTFNAEPSFKDAPRAARSRRLLPAVAGPALTPELSADQE